MHKTQLHKINSLVIFVLFSIFLFQCKSKESVKDTFFQSIENYFAKKGWNFPINILDTTLLIKYYRDTTSLKIIPIGFDNDIKKIQGFFYKKKYLELILKKALLDTSKTQINGYNLSNPNIFIDTTDFGTANTPKFFLAFYQSRYKINKDSSSHGIPCEDCVLEEGNKILKYPSAIFFELNNTKDSLIFSRID